MGMFRNVKTVDKLSTDMHPGGTHFAIDPAHTGQRESLVQLDHTDHARPVWAWAGTGTPMFRMSRQEAADLGACLLEAAFWPESQEWEDDGRFTFTRPVPRDPELDRQVGWTIRMGDALSVLKDIPTRSAQAGITSSPYFQQRDYDELLQIGQERTVQGYVDRVREVGVELYRVIQDSGVLFWNIADSWNGSGGVGGDYRSEDGSYRVVPASGAHDPTRPDKARLLVPERICIAFEEIGWIPRARFHWLTENALRGAPDRPSQDSEDILMFVKQEKYLWHQDAVLMDSAPSSRAQLQSDYTGEAQYGGYEADGLENPSDTKRRVVETMRNRDGKVLLRGTWRIPRGPQPVVEVPEYGLVRGIASFPELLPRICIELASDPGDVILDPFCGMATTGLAALRTKRSFLGIELSPRYRAAGAQRLQDAGFGHQECERPIAPNHWMLRQKMPLFSAR